MRQIKQRKEELNAVERRKVEEEKKLKQVLNGQNETQQLRDSNNSSSHFKHRALMSVA